MDNGKKMCDNLSLNGHFIPLADSPKSVDVCGAEVSLSVLVRNGSEGVLFHSRQSKSIRQTFIESNSECTGFLMGFPSIVSVVSLNPQKV